jgi:hypothetical protein
MSAFRVINNTNTSLPLSTSFTIQPGKEVLVEALTLEIMRLERSKLITIIETTSKTLDLEPDFIGVKSTGQQESNDFCWNSATW